LLFLLQFVAVVAASECVLYAFLFACQYHYEKFFDLFSN